MLDCTMDWEKGEALTFVFSCCSFASSSLQILRATEIPEEVEEKSGDQNPVSLPRSQRQSQG